MQDNAEEINEVADTVYYELLDHAAYEGMSLDDVLTILSIVIALIEKMKAKVH